MSSRADPIAIVGMRGRFPGADDLDRYWANLARGIESITTLSADDVLAAGVPDDVARLPGYVKAAPVLERVDEFDAEFFGFSARDASLTDPQHRLFLETSWEALEDAGYDPSAYPGAIGVFGGCEQSTYQYQLYLNRESLGYLDGMQLMVTNDKDHLCTQVSYRLNLRGPSVVVQTTCSTSLVAVTLACEALQAGRCDMALAGGVTVRVPQRGGYFYTPGSILSPDGHCRPFDAEAQGTIVGSGVGIVVLKRLGSALADGDNVRAVILGVGINNDGSDKAGYTAPSFRGQAAAIRAAQSAAGVSPESIGYIEAHGTGTILGDPIELSALTEVFKEQTDHRGFCAIGSVKSNFGHLSCAAGVAGLIKTVLVLEHGAVPPTVHYRAPNPAIDFASSPFYVTTHLRPWERNGVPRRAGVSSFGVGGTNVHVVVEEAPANRTSKQQRPRQLITLSARTLESLDRATERLAAHLELHPELDLADVAFTLHVGRRAFRHRRTLLTRYDDQAGAIAALRDPAQLVAAVASAGRPVVFMFPGQGSQYPGMAEGLYATEPVVRRAIDHCAKVLEPHVGADLRRILFPRARGRKQAADQLLNTEWAQPALFIVEYAVGELLRSWGIQPTAMIGHSVGDYVAATFAGVMSLDDALLLIARRGQLVASMPRGSMLAVMADASTVARFLDRDVSLAGENAPGYSVLSGPDAAIDRVEATLASEKIAARRLHTSHAFHSAMMDPILAAFEDCVAGFRLSEPAVPFVSTLSGRWADVAVTQPRYWSDQLRSTVRFADALRAVGAANSPVDKYPIFLEVGPGRALTTFASLTVKSDGAAPLCIASLPGYGDERLDIDTLFNALGNLWVAGIAVDWGGFHKTERCKRVALPTYPFERRSYWIGAPPDGAARHEPRDTSAWFYRPSWQPASPAGGTAEALSGRRILVFDDETGLARAVAQRMNDHEVRPVIVRRGVDFSYLSDDTYVMNPTQPEHFARLAVEVCKGDGRLAGVIDCWSAGPPGRTDLDVAGVETCLAPMRLAHALSGQPTLRPLPILLVARGTAKVGPSDSLDPARALGIGVAKVIPQEHPGLRLAHLDVDADETVAEHILAELAAGAAEPAVALREGRRLIESYERVLIDSIGAPLGWPERPVVFVTGGLGHIGMNLAEQMFNRLRARLVLLGRAALPEPGQWAAKAEDPQISGDIRALLKRLARMHAERDDIVVVNADLNRREQVIAAVEDTMARLGRIDVVIHGAGRVDAAAFASAADTGPSVVEAQFSPKLRGLLHLIEAMRGREPKRWILHSSISSVLGGLGLAAYAGVNAVLDTMALEGGNGWLSIGWDAWDNALEAHSEGMPVPIYPPEGADAFLRLLSADIGPHALVVVNDLARRLRAWVRHGDGDAQRKAAGVARHPRPNLSTPFEEPRTDTERRLAEIWGVQLGVDAVGIHDRFLDLGGHSLLAVQVASEIRDAFQIELPVLRLFQAPTVGQLAEIIDRAETSGEVSNKAVASPVFEPPKPTPVPEDNTPGAAAKASFREFYDGITRRLEQSGVGEASFFLNYGYISLGDGDEARFDVTGGVLNPSSIRLAYELVGATDLRGRHVLDVGCGRGGTVALLADQFGAEVTGVDLAPEAIAFCRRMHRQPNVRFYVGDAERLPEENESIDVVTNIESSHTYPNLRSFFAEVRRVLKADGTFLYTDLLPVQRWAEVRVLLASLRFKLLDDRHITPNVLASCDAVAATRARAFGAEDALIDNFLAVPGSTVYEQMRSAAWEYRILRARRE